MNAQAVIAQIKHWLFEIATFVLVLMLAVTALKLIGVQIPLRAIGHVELAYLCGALWLLRK
jgi:hypothetical protein